MTRCTIYNKETGIYDLAPEFSKEYGTFELIQELGYLEEENILLRNSLKVATSIIERVKIFVKENTND